MDQRNVEEEVHGLAVGDGADLALEQLVDRVVPCGTVRYPLAPNSTDALRTASCSAPLGRVPADSLPECMASMACSR